jgi:hypothetical protein
VRSVSLESTEATPPSDLYQWSCERRVSFALGRGWANDFRVLCNPSRTDTRRGDHCLQADLSLPNESAYLQCVINFRITDDSAEQLPENIRKPADLIFRP